MTRSSTSRRRRGKLRRFVEGSDHAIRLKAEIMVDHFHDQVLAQGKIGGAARARVVTNGIERAIQYYHAISDRAGPAKTDGMLECVRGHEEGQRDGDEETSVHSGVQGQGSDGGAAGRPYDQGDRGQARSTSEPDQQLEAASTGRTAGTVRGRQEPAAEGVRCDHSRPARQDRGVDRGARFFARGLGR